MVRKILAAPMSRVKATARKKVVRAESAAPKRYRFSITPISTHWSFSKGALLL